MIRFPMNNFGIIAEAEMVPGDFLWGAPQWVVPAIVIAVVMAILVVWNYSQKGIVAPVRLLAMILKLAAIGLIAVCLLEPMRSGTRPRPKANMMPILVDNSQSMQLKSVNADKSRGQQVAALMDEDSSWRIRLAQAFDVRPYLFDARLESIETFDELPMDGYVSSLKTSLTAVSERFADRPIGGAILFTDGNLTDPPADDFDWKSLGYPVYPVLPGRDDQVRDLRISDVSTRQTDFESAPITLHAKIDSVAMGNQDGFVQLIDVASGKLVEEKKVSLSDSSEPQEVRFRFRPNAESSYACAEHYAGSGQERSGECEICKAALIKNDVRLYRLVTFTESDRAAMEKSDASSEADTAEATLANNQRLVTIVRKAGPYRILYLAGRPNWEFKFLRRALEEDAEVEVTGLLRIANKEPKFSFRDKGVSSTNPLFQGVGDDQEDAAQQYDEPVLIRIGNKSNDELSEGFPDSAEGLFGYHGLILDDIEPGFFTQDQMLLIRRFVAARGGGLLMLGGQESFANKEFGDSPLGELSPVYAPRASDPSNNGAYKLLLTREGMLQPWVRLRETEVSEKARLEKMPTFTSLNPVGEVKPGASQLASVQTDGGKNLPALLAQRFGKGRSAAIPIGDMWRWSMRRDEEQPDDPAQLWRQLLHWLVNDVPRRSEVRVEKDADPSEPVQIFATARDDAFLPMDNAEVQLTINPFNGDPFTIKAEPDDVTPGRYKASYWSREPGGYQVTAAIKSADGSEVGQSTSGWTAQSNAAEFNQLQLNRKLLQRIAEETGGEVISDDDLDAFVADLPNRKVPVTETWVYPIWHRPWIMMLAMLCLCMEWGVRRMKGLA